MCVSMRIHKFVKLVEAEVADPNTNGVAILGEVGSALSNARYGWPEMRSLEFRKTVLKILRRRGKVRNAAFSAPDSYDEWTFSAYKV